MSASPAISATPRHILISHVYSSDNKGDAALTSVLIADLRRVFPGAEMTILKLESVVRHGHFEGVPEQPSFMYYVANRYRHPLLKLAYASYMVSATLAWAAWHRATGQHLYLPKHLQKIAQLYHDADLIVPVGGGYMRSRTGLLNRLNIPLLLHPLWFGYLLGKPTVLYSQSIGPFQNGFETWLAACVLKRMTLILVREDTSLALLAGIGVTKNAVRGIDSGFLLRSSQPVNLRQKYGLPSWQLLVGVTVRSWLGGAAQAHYEEAVAKALDRLVEAWGVYVIFIPQVTATKGDDDRLVSRRVQALMRHRSVSTLVEGTPDHHAIKAIYDNLDVLLGTRFHSVIFSLTSYVPVVAIEYEHKTSGIMRDLRLGRWVIPIEEVTAPGLTKLLLELMDDRIEYREHLTTHLPPYVREAQKTADRLAQSYQAAVQAHRHRR